jgi:hypothetical protein
MIIKQPSLLEIMKSFLVKVATAATLLVLLLVKSNNKNGHHQQIIPIVNSFVITSASITVPITQRIAFSTQRKLTSIHSMAPIINGASSDLVIGPKVVLTAKIDDDDDDDPLLLKKIETIIASTAMKTPTTSIADDNNDNNDLIISSSLSSTQQQPLPPPIVESPPISFPKYLTMQERRVVITVRYTQDSGLKPYFLTVAKKLKATHPDIIIERKLLPNDNKDTDIDSSSGIFEVCVDTKVIIPRGGSRSSRSGRTKASSGRSVTAQSYYGSYSSSSSRSIFVSMHELDTAIARARRKRRPNSTYGAITTGNTPSTGVVVNTPTTSTSSRQQRKQNS